MRRVRGPLFPLFRHPVAPLTRTGRVVVLALLAVWAFCLTVAWSPAFRSLCPACWWKPFPRVVEALAGWTRGARCVPVRAARVPSPVR